MLEVARVLYGSQNYLLSDENSDKDYKVLLCPSYYDLYNLHKVEKNDLRNLDPEHFSPMDVRQFDSLVLKCNPNVLEMVFSLEWQFSDSQFKEYVELAKNLLSSGYVAVQWKNFYAATQGLALNSLKRYGMDNPKSVSRAYYYYNLVKALATQGFYMTKETWRNSFYCDNARQRRFQSHLYNLTQEAEKVVEAFSVNQAEFEEMAFKWCKKHDSYYMNALFMYSEKLHQFMYNYVKEQL